MHKSMIASFAFISLGACSDKPGDRLIMLEDSANRYIEVREGRPGSVSTRDAVVDGRRDLKEMREVHGQLEDVFADINGLENPRLIVESKNRSFYRVIYRYGDREALKAIATKLDLVVAEELREVDVIAIRVSMNGHHLKSEKTNGIVKVEDIACDEDGSWNLPGVTSDDISRFLEVRFRRPVVNLTGLKGRWSIRLSGEAVRLFPRNGEKNNLDETGLVLAWEKVKISVLVVKDRPLN